MKSRAISPLSGFLKLKVENGKVRSYSISPHPPSHWRRSPFSTKLGKAERAKVGVGVVCRIGDGPPTPSSRQRLLHKDLFKIVGR